MIAPSESLDINPPMHQNSQKKRGKNVFRIFCQNNFWRENETTGETVTWQNCNCHGYIIFCSRRSDIYKNHKENKDQSVSSLTWRTRTCLLRRSRFCYYRPLFTQLFTSYAQREDPEIYCTPFFFSSNRTMVPHGSVVCSLSIPVLRNPILF